MFLLAFYLFVLEVGIEPTLPKELDFESSASTNSATKAIKGSKLTIVSSLQKFLRFLIVHYPPNLMPLFYI